MRTFIDWMIDRMNRAGVFDSCVRIVQPLPEGMGEVINTQGGLYHVVLRGMTEGKPFEAIERIECVRDCLNPFTQWEEVEEAACAPELRFAFSNTTEAGIEYRPGVDTFPSKVARLLAARRRRGLPGLIFLPCELIEHNGDSLRECVLRYLADDEETAGYVRRECIFCNTLVDRIVSGYPGSEAPGYWEKIGFEDRLLSAGEPFHLFVIQGPERVADELPFAEAGLNVVFTSDLIPYRTRKVRFLNGAHTSSVPAAITAGMTYVDEMVRDPYFNSFLRGVLFEEVFPTVPLPDEEKRRYAESIMERLANPFAHHRLASILMNSVSKWRVRVLPSILDYVKIRGALPERLAGSMAGLIDCYRHREINDSPEVREFFAAKPSAREILANSEFWGMDLNAIDGFTRLVEERLSR